jgi:hypothetical protein
VVTASTRVTEILSAVLADSGGAADSAGILVGLCVRAVPVSGVGLALMTDQGPAGTVAATDGGAQRLEDLQFTFGEGPCVDASTTGRPVLVPDLAESESLRWPEFVPAARAAGLRAVFALPLQVGGIRLGVLDLYRENAGMLASDQLAEALSFADAATLLLLHLQAEDSGSGNRLAVLDDRAEVHQATGVVSVRAGVGLAQALLLLRARAYSEGRPLGELARDVLDGVVEVGAQQDDR